MERSRIWRKTGSDRFVDDESLGVAACSLLPVTAGDEVGLTKFPPLDSMARTTKDGEISTSKFRSVLSAKAIVDHGNHHTTCRSPTPQGDPDAC